MRKTIFMLSFVCLIIMMSACGNDKTNNEVSGNGVDNGLSSQEVSQQQIEVKDLEIMEYGYDRDSDGYLQVAGVFKNPNKEHTAKFVNINWTIEDDNGVVISEPSAVKTIGPGELVVMSFPAIQHQDFDEINVELEIKDENWIIEEAPLVTSSDILLTDISVEEDYYKAHVVSGFIENTSEFDISSVGVGIIFKKDNKIVGGSSSEIRSPLNAGKKYDFKQASSIAFPEIDDYEIYFYNIKVK